MDDPEEKDVKVKALDEDDIALLKTYGLGPYSERIKTAEADVKRIAKEVNDVCGIKESDTGLAPPSRWDLVSDKQAMQEEQPLQARTTSSAVSAQRCLARQLGMLSVVQESEPLHALMQHVVVKASSLLPVSGHRGRTFVRLYALLPQASCRTGLCSDARRPSAVAYTLRPKSAALLPFAGQSSQGICQ